MKLAVLTGGTSDERAVALQSGIQVAGALREAGHEVVTVDTVDGVMTERTERRWADHGIGQATPPALDTPGGSEADRIVSLLRDPATAEAELYFLALHGGAGEDGTVQALLDLVGVPYTGSDRLGCSLAMDKEVGKRLLRDAGVATPDWRTGPCDAADVEAALGLPVVVKASGGGSSLRLVLAHDRDELEAAIDESRGWDDVVLFERYVEGREFTVGVLGSEILPVGEIIPDHEFFDYACKYQSGKAVETFPAPIPRALGDRLRALALRTHEALRLRDYSRVDFIVDEGGRPWCLEANALPGMTSNSLMPKAAEAAGFGFSELCDRIVRLARERARGRPSRSTSE